MNPHEHFLDGVSGQLKWYVYVLLDPSSGAPLYVGKGCGPRVFAHLYEALRSNALEQNANANEKAKVARIRSILESGSSPRHYILRHGFKSQDEAYAYEAITIDAYRLAGIEVANQVRGHNVELGSATIARINAKYGCTHTMDKGDFELPAVLYRLNPYDHNWTDAEIFDRIKCCWPAARWRRDKIQVACAVSDHVIRAVFRVDPHGWREASTGYWSFERLPIEAGHPALTWVRGNVRQLFQNDKGRNKARVRVLYVGPWNR